MQILEQISENEMIAAFLNGELNSVRFADALRNEMDSLKIAQKIVTTPDFSNQHENDLRKKLFARYRGYGDNKELFENFPNDMVWYRATLTKDEVLKIKYINYSYWNDLSDNTRLSTVAAKNIERGYEAFHVENTNFIKAVEWLKNGNIFPEMILVAENPDADLVVLEGHVRLTAYSLAPQCIPDPVKVIVGISQHIIDWPEYPDELSPVTENSTQVQEIAE